MRSEHADVGPLVRDDSQPLRTKIVATIGTPELYLEAQAVGLDGRTLGADLDYDYIVRGFFEAGVDIIRLNCSHIGVGDVARRFFALKAAILDCEKACQKSRRMAVLADLPGPKIRFELGDTAIPIEVGQEFVVDLSEEVNEAPRHTVYVDQRPLREALDSVDDSWSSRPGCAVGITSDFADNVIGCSSGLSGERFTGLMAQVAVSNPRSRGSLVFVGDGEVVLEVDEKDPTGGSLTCHVVSTKVDSLKGNKGFTLKHIDIDIPTFTSTDRDLLAELLRAEYADEFGGERLPYWEPLLAFIGLSFTQTVDDVLRIREAIERSLIGKRYPGEAEPIGEDQARLESPAIVAKIETRKGWLNRNFILDIADCAMVARGDLGLQLDVEEVPRRQKELIHLCNKRGKPVITATEMLKSMVDSIEPTRAEGSDVFNAIEDGSDAVMMSEETAKGRFPFHTVRKMVLIAEKAELHVELFREDLEGANAQGVDEDRLAQHLERKSYLQRQTLVDFLKDDFERIKANEERLRKAAGYLVQQAGFVKELLAREESARLTWRASLYGEKLGKAAKQETTNRITQATCTLTEASETRAIVAPSASGRTARMISRLRPRIPVIGAAHDLMNMRKLIVSFGVIPICIGKVDGGQSTDFMFDTFRNEVARHPYLRQLLAGRCNVVFTAGTPVNTPGTTNLVQMKPMREP